MRRVMLSHPLPVFGLVSHYLTNNLIGRSPLPTSSVEHMGYYRRFPDAIPHIGVRSIALLALSPVSPEGSPRLACFSHAASVQSEPGSNSSIEATPELSLGCRQFQNDPSNRVYPFRNRHGRSFPRTSTCVDARSPPPARRRDFVGVLKFITRVRQRPGPVKIPTTGLTGLTDPGSGFAGDDPQW